MKLLLVFMPSFFILACNEISFKSDKNLKSTENQDTASFNDTSENWDWKPLEDTALIEKFRTDNGNEIEFWGEQPFDLKERVVIKNKQGVKEFDLNNNSYLGNHTAYLWDSQDYVVLRYGCGVPCWGAKVLPLNKKDTIREYLMYLLTDSIRNLIAYPDSLFTHRLIIENLKSGIKINVDYESCDAATPIFCIDTVFIKGKKFHMQWNSGTRLQQINKDTVIDIADLF